MKLDIANGIHASCQWHSKAGSLAMSFVIGIVVSVEGIKEALHRSSSQHLPQQHFMIIVSTCRARSSCQ